MSKRPISSSATATSNPTRVKNLVIWALVIAAVVALGLILFLNLRSPGEIEGLVRVAGLPQDHNNNAQYDAPDKPPAGGVHYDRWQNCGVYEEPIEIGNALHSLEHGAVWITYSPELPADQVSRLQERVSSQSYLLLSPYPGQESPLVLTAWGVQLEASSATDSRVDEFIQRFRLGPTTPELGATCEGGVGQPMT